MATNGRSWIITAWRHIVVGCMYSDTRSNMLVYSNLSIYLVFHSLLHISGYLSGIVACGVAHYWSPMFQVVGMLNLRAGWEMLAAWVLFWHPLNIGYVCLSFFFHLIHLYILLLQKVCRPHSFKWDNLRAIMVFPYVVLLPWYPVFCVIMYNRSWYCGVTLFLWFCFTGNCHSLVV